MVSMREVLMKKINLNLLETFFAVYKYQSYTKAASFLDCTPSNVRQKLQRLEAITGESYFVKKSKMLLPTKAGEVLYSKSFKHFHSLELEVNALQSQQSRNHLEILTSTGASMLWTVDIVNEFMESHKGYTFGVHTTEKPVMEPGSMYDLLVLPQNLEQGHYVKMSGGRFTTKLYASREYVAQHGVPETPEDLDHHKLVSFYHKSYSYRGDTDWSLRIGRPLSDPRNPSLIINNMMGITQAIVSGLGISALTNNNPYIKSHDLVPILPEYSGPPVNFYIFYNTLLGNTPLVKFLERKFAIKDSESLAA